MAMDKPHNVSVAQALPTPHEEYLRHLMGPPGEFSKLASANLYPPHLRGYKKKTQQRLLPAFGYLDTLAYINNLHTSSSLP